VTTTATGKATAVPDLLSADVTVSTNGLTAAGVLSDDSTHTQQLLNSLLKDGVNARDVQTTSINLNPTFDRHGVITGYAASNSLTIKFRNIKTAGTKLDDLVQSAGDAARINDVSLGFSDQDAYLAKARADAVRRAKAQAKVMADNAGASLGRVKTITDVTNTEFSPVARQADFAASATSASVPVAGGTQDITVQVRTVFELS
jgi:hypothetical protein